jgi:D-arabinose 1-dehydrogenase-like Zn-dependent alcohol dehydrogenase
MNYKAWVTKAAKQPMVLETVDLGPLGAEDVEVAVEHCGLCHSDLSVFNNEWGTSQYPAILGHEVVGPVTATNRALPDEQYQRGLRSTRIRQSPLPHRAGSGFLILTSEFSK